ncbi:metallophosphoesterase [Paenibacillus sp. J2TS4]|uniref:metallophosphoesterase family protein n=1 Tax=Paenibacillus sp. J2TS4 TaxID=2807194 RepID=UPI001B06C2ED|nr:metallophosphoesterase [Paenibacillus sp. J2TS4]GIP31199.1 hypothetical protein J2TS4_04090 [Paenibacillus sp. J2TS4]
MIKLKWIYFMTFICTIIIAVSTLTASGSSLSAQEAEGSSIAFSVLSDIHVQAWNPQSQHKFQAALEDLRRINSNQDALIVNGDLGNGAQADYDAIKRIIRKGPNPPLFYTLGNHEFYQAWINAAGRWDADHFPNGEKEQASISRFLKFTGRDSVYDDVWIHGFHFIFLGSEKYRQNDPEVLENAYLSPTQLAWLKDKLGEGDESGRPIFVFLHQPLPNSVSGSKERGVVQHEELRQILQLYPNVILFSGHTHWNLADRKMLDYDGFWMVNSSSVYQPWTNQGQPAGTESSEGLYVEVRDQTVHIRGRSFARKGWIAEAQYKITFP